VKKMLIEFISLHYQTLQEKLVQLRRGVKIHGSTTVQTRGSQLVTKHLQIKKASYSQTGLEGFTNGR